MRPTRPLVALFVGWLLLSLAVAIFDVPRMIWALYGAGVVLIAVVDALHGSGELSVERFVAGSWSLGSWTKVRLRVANAGEDTARVEVFDGVPDRVEFEGLPQSLDVPAGGGAEFEYRVRALARGNLSFGPTELLRPSPLGLWARRLRLGGEDKVAVYPNFSAISGYALRALDDRISLMGIRKKPRRGQGMEFHQLRDYIAGDALRQVDWKATSRRRKLISREYQEERDQQVLFLIDCGRRMASESGELSHFDHCLNAVLLLTYVALRQGDAVGFLTFSGVDRWLPPKKGRATLNSILNHVYDLETTLSPPDYAEAAARAMTLQPRRALVILLTNLREEDHEELEPALHLLRRRHLVVLASLREMNIDRMAEAPVEQIEDALNRCAALAYRQERRRAIEQFGGRGFVTLDLPPDRLPVALANQYMDIKRAGAL